MHNPVEILYIPDVSIQEGLGRVLRSSPTIFPTTRKTIVVVDDDAALREALHLILDDDYDVIDAPDATVALTVLASKNTDLVLLDLLMTGTDGLAVLERQHTFRSRPPIIILSGLNNAWTAATAMRLGALDYVTKPFDEEALLSLIRQTLEQPTAQSSGRQRPRKNHITLVGTDLGLYASLAVLLRDHCWIRRVETLVALRPSGITALPDVVVADSSALGPRAAETLSRFYAESPNAWVVQLGSSKEPEVIGPSRRRTVLSTPALVGAVLKEISQRITRLPDSCHAYSPRVVAAINHLGVHYSDASVNRVGRAVGVSADHLSALFRKEIGLSLKRYASEVRVEVAKWLLLEGGEKIESVAASIGLHDASHLSRLFLKHTGERPGAYRRRTVDDAR